MGLLYLSFMQTAKLTFPGISSRAWEHPADRTALNALKQVPGLDAAIKYIFGHITERQIRLLYMASSIRVSPQQLPRVHELAQDVYRIFDLQQHPEIYVVQRPVLNASAVGWNNPFITLHSATIESLSDEELAGIIGHEVGHIKSGHVLYNTVLSILLMLSARIGFLPAQLPLYAIILPLLEWSRKAELSSDRAELLATQSVDVSIKTHMKLAGGNVVGLNQDEFMAQAAEYRQNGHALDSIFKLLNVLDKTHPFATVRAAEIQAWSESEQYKSILQGNYPTGDGGWEEMQQDVKEAASSYSTDFTRATEPFKDIASEVAKGAESAANTAKEVLKDLFGRK